MIHILGACMILFASTASGMLIAGKYRNRPREIRQWRSALQSIEAEIVYGRVPIEELAGHLSGQLPQPLASFFDRLHKKLNADGPSLREAWTESIELFWPETSLKKAEKEVLLQFGATLGTQDTENQKKHIQLALAHLEREEAEARNAQAANEKLMRNLGFLTGLLLVLLFI
ncbi:MULTISPECIES: stage III sporulation protein SpoIIIAB [unclassified Sporolactobacillus]|uniref:stage III sporulation protein SpoIIIAB n=1 Tax=unclassified Sporolactobacillus TaxID=2628533 RepID=UPI0023683687|nr:stage III sporulation protein SpoIIIAB [Sporolactobacillus sp. CQH2019]MDD9149291.1 stage III sporulation protein SpoIIIAB [Sporolactobacillus sp. CQH2019]